MLYAAVTSQPSACEFIILSFVLLGRQTGNNQRNAPDCLVDNVYLPHRKFPGPVHVVPGPQLSWEARAIGVQHYKNAESFSA
jgi:hypothetical protein